MKSSKKLISIFIGVLLLCILTFFIYTRFFLDAYVLKVDKLILNNNIYIQSGIVSINDEKNLGKTIGIATKGERTITDLIFPTWVIEFKNDSDHNHLMVKGLMDLGTIYIKKD